MSLVEKVAKKLKMDPNSLMYESLLRWFEEEIATINAEIAEIKLKYNVKDSTELEEKIKRRELSEHPTWEDLIILENLLAEKKKLEEGLKLVKESK